MTKFHVYNDTERPKNDDPLINNFVGYLANSFILTNM